MAETEQTAKSFATFDRTARGFGGTSGEEEHVADTLMRTFLMLKSGSRFVRVQLTGKGDDGAGFGSKPVILRRALTRTVVNIYDGATTRDCSAFKCVQVEMIREVIAEKKLTPEGRCLILERVHDGEDGVRLVMCRLNSNGTADPSVQSIFAGIFADTIGIEQYRDFFAEIGSVEDFHNLSNETKMRAGSG